MILVALGLLLGIAGLLWVMVIAIVEADRREHADEREPYEEDPRLRETKAAS